ncbi:GEVED domain-containing protein [Hymenobacter rubidus]|uniref:GEVED domain-containing protein n=1 Tax=Hymenobacter rubidus TaxID=1441626 RepID=UPI00191CDD07|nr:GEVED domain-containing protein [Hymenobacter rubidus]
MAVLLALGASPTAQAQGTCGMVAAACTPGTASSPIASSFGLAILNVTVGTSVLANRTAYTTGYHDFTCTANAPLVVGQSYPISVRTTTNAVQNVLVWIDYSNDGAFSANELVFQDLVGTTATHSGTFTPPGTAVLGTRLRMRVATDYFGSPIPTSCSTPVYSQTEDYSVTLSANVNPPVAAFTTSGNTTCTGCVQFTDASQNVPTSWSWNFGDGTPVSTLRNPNHCYTTAGTYSVTLTATNAAGSNTSAATSIVYNTSVPLAASCTPLTSAYFANYGITRFRLGTIDNTSADGSAGYQDFTCPQRTEVIAGVNYPMIITTGGTNPHDIRVYLDKNNDGILTTTEQLFVSLNTASPGTTFTFTVPTGTVLNQPLRLRVIADAVGSAMGPCTNQTAGQAEDYTVIARPNTLPPSVNFSTNYVAGGCVNPIQFTDLTTNLPTSWLWDFGDGYTGPQQTQQNPLHTYAASGTYNVTLSATNTNGTASVTRLNAVTIQVPCLTYCASNGTGNSFWITSVSASNATPAFTNNSVNSATGYTLYTTPLISTYPGTSLNFTVGTNLAIQHRTAVWVDWNRNGTFDTSELVINGAPTTIPPPSTFTGVIAVPTTASGNTYRVRVQAVVNTNAPNACAINIANAEVEDYQLRVLPLATRDALALPSLGLFPNPTQDGHVKLSLPDAAAAGLYTTEVQNLLGATVLRTTLRLGPGADAELDLSGLASGVYVLRLRDAQGQTALRRLVRE